MIRAALICASPAAILALAAFLFCAVEKIGRDESACCCPGTRPAGRDGAQPQQLPSHPDRPLRP